MVSLLRSREAGGCPRIPVSPHSLPRPEVLADALCHTRDHLHQEGGCCGPKHHTHQWGIFFGFFLLLFGQNSSLNSGFLLSPRPVRFLCLSVFTFGCLGLDSFHGSPLPQNKSALGRRARFQNWAWAPRREEDTVTLLGCLPLSHLPTCSADFLPKPLQYFSALFFSHCYLGLSLPGSLLSRRH